VANDSYLIDVAEPSRAFQRLSGEALEIPGTFPSDRFRAGKRARRG
jgi:hypothetical protein